MRLNHFPLPTAWYSYRRARDDYSEGILLDANENPLGYSTHHDQVAKKTELDETEGLGLHRCPSLARTDQVQDRRYPREPAKERVVPVRSGVTWTRPMRHSVSVGREVVRLSARATG